MFIAPLGAIEFMFADSNARVSEMERFDARTFDVIPPPAKLLAEIAPVPMLLPDTEYNPN